MQEGHLAEEGAEERHLSSSLSASSTPHTDSTSQQLPEDSWAALSASSLIV